MRKRGTEVRKSLLGNERPCRLNLIAFSCVLHRGCTIFGAYSLPYWSQMRWPEPVAFHLEAFVLTQLRLCGVFDALTDRFLVPKRRPVLW